MNSDTSNRSIIERDGKTITVIDAKKSYLTKDVPKKIDGLFQLFSIESNYSNAPAFSKEETKKAIEEMSKNISLQGKLKVSATSTLGSSGSLNYSPSNLIDADINNSWVEGSKGNGIGEFLTFEINNTTSDLELYNYISIFNGFRANSNLWNSNSRVKKLKMYVDNNTYGIISLRDTPFAQIIYLPEDINVSRNKVISVKLEIVEVFDGDKFKDTCISFVNFGIYKEN